MNTVHGSQEMVAQEPWYKYGIAFLVLEMVIAVAVSAYSLFMTFHGIGGFPGKH